MVVVNVVVVVDAVVEYLYDVVLIGEELVFDI